MSDFKRAKDDLLFFSKRFKGILDIIPDLEKISNINNYIREKEKSLVRIDEEQRKASKEFRQLTDRVATLTVKEKMIIHDAKTEATKWQDEYMLWEKDSRDHLTKELDEQRRSFKEENNVLTQKIASKRQELDDLVVSTKEHEDRYESIKKTIDDLRGRL